MSKSTISLKSVVVAALAATCAVGAAAGSASAEQAGEAGEVTLTYHFDRSQLATEDGAAEAYRQLMDQAREACRYPAGRTPESNKVDRQCAADLVAKVVAATRAPALSERHARAAGHAQPRG